MSTVAPSKGVYEPYHRFTINREKTAKIIKKPRNKQACFRYIPSIREYRFKSRNRTGRYMYFI